MIYEAKTTITALVWHFWHHCDLENKFMGEWGAESDSEGFLSFYHLLKHKKKTKKGNTLLPFILQPVMYQMQKNFPSGLHTTEQDQFFQKSRFLCSTRTYCKFLKNGTNRRSPVEVTVMHNFKDLASMVTPKSSKGATDSWPGQHQL